MKHTDEAFLALEEQLRETKEELARVKEENARLRGEAVRTPANDDYLALIQIMDRARKLAFLVEEPEEAKPRFVMNADGDLKRME